MAEMRASMKLFREVKKDDTDAWNDSDVSF
jgi:hypothetical protein